MKHEPAEMKYEERYSHKHQVSTSRGIRYWNWWYNLYRCPICQQTRKRLANLDRRNRLRTPVCKGNG